MKSYAIVQMDAMGAFEVIGNYSGKTPAEAFSSFLIDDPDFEGEAEVYEIGPGSAFRRYDGETEEKPL